MITNSSTHSTSHEANFHTRSQWIRVSKARPCKICGKHDWCSYSADQTVACCARIESRTRAGNAGWIHKLTDAVRIPKLVTPPRPKSVPNLNKLAVDCVSHMTPSRIGWLANELNLSIESINAFTVGFNASRNVFSFPMRNLAGRVIGIRYRTFDGDKFSEKGGKEGLFFAPNSSDSSYLIICEGPTDAMAMRDLGYKSVVGRSNCRGNVDQLVELSKRFKKTLVVPDNDVPGIDGAKDLIRQIENAWMLLPPADDVRSVFNDIEMADTFRTRIGQWITSKEW